MINNSKGSYGGGLTEFNVIISCVEINGTQTCDMEFINSNFARNKAIYGGVISNYNMLEFASI